MVFLMTMQIENAPAHIDDDDLMNPDGGTTKVVRILCATEKDVTHMMIETIHALFFVKPLKLCKTVGWCTEYHWQHPKYANAYIHADYGEIDHVILADHHPVVELP